MTWRVDVEGGDILCQGLPDLLGIASKIMEPLSRVCVKIIGVANCLLK